MITTQYDDKVIDTLNNDKRLNLLKFFCFPMRTGKTFKSINLHTPHLIKKMGYKWSILTSPLNGIIKQNEQELKAICALNNFVYANDLSTIKNMLDRDIPVVSYWTNAGAFTQPDRSEFLSKIDISKVAIFIDEADWGSVSGANNLMATKGYSYPEYRGSMYEFVSLIAKKSPATYAYTATPNYEVRNFLDTVGDLKYELITPMLEGEQKVYAPRVAWFGKSTFYNPTTNPLFDETNDTIKTMAKMINSAVSIELATRFKRSMLIQIQDKDEELNDEEVVNRIATDSTLYGPLLKVVQKDEFVGASMAHDKIYLFNLFGNTEVLTKPEMTKFGFDPNESAETNIMNAIDDPKNPLRILLVKQMAGRGVTMKTVKEVMSLRTADTRSNLGSITESAEQLIGRAKSPYFGEVTIPQLYKDYDGDCQKISPELFSDPRINTYNTYLVNNDKYTTAIEKHIKFDACTLDMVTLPEPIECCGECGALKKHWRKLPDIEIDTAKLDELLVA